MIRIINQSISPKQGSQGSRLLSAVRQHYHEQNRRIDPRICCYHINTSLPFGSQFNTWPGKKYNNLHKSRQNVQSFKIGTIYQNGHSTNYKRKRQNVHGSTITSNHAICYYSTSNTNDDNNNNNQNIDQYYKQLDIFSRTYQNIPKLKTDTMMQYLNLKTCSDEEIHSILEKISQQSNDDKTMIYFDQLESYVKHTVLLPKLHSLGEINHASVDQFANIISKSIWKTLFHNSSFSNTNTSISKKEFTTILQKYCTDIPISKLASLTTNMFLVGISVGVLIPVMPFVIIDVLKLNVGEFGIITSAFAIGKIVGNVPSAILTEKYGKKVSMFDVHL